MMACFLNSAPLVRGGGGVPFQRLEQNVHFLTLPRSTRCVMMAVSNKRTSDSTVSALNTDGSEQFPERQVWNELGEPVNTSTLANCVVFLYPRASTPGCTTQACGFRDNHVKFHALGYDVYGLSYDTPNAQLKWKEKQQLPYTLLSDEVSTGLIKALGCHKATNSGRPSVIRSHFILGDNGYILDKHVKISPKDSVSYALQFCSKNPTFTTSNSKPISSTSTNDQNTTPISPSPSKTPQSQFSIQSLSQPTISERTELLQQMSIILMMQRNLNEFQESEHAAFLIHELRKIKQQLQM